MVEGRGACLFPQCTLPGRCSRHFESGTAVPDVLIDEFENDGTRDEPRPELFDVILPAATCTPAMHLRSLLGTCTGTARRRAHAPAGQCSTSRSGIGKSLGSPGGSPGTDSPGRGSDQAVGLAQGDPDPGTAPPLAGLDAFGVGERRQPHPVEQPHGGALFGWAQPPHHLFDVHDAHVTDVTSKSQPAHPVGSWPAAKGVDEDGGVEQDTSHSRLSYPTRRSSEVRC